MNRRQLLGLLLGLGGLAAAGGVLAEPFPRLQELRRRLEEGRWRDRGGISLDRAVTRIREGLGERVLSAKTFQDDHREVHQIRIINDQGRVRRIRVDARTGRLLDFGGH